MLYTPGDRHDFNCKLQTLIENESLRQEMGDRAKDSIQQYGWSQAIQNLVDIWQQQINQKLSVNNDQLSINHQLSTINSQLITNN